MANPLTRRMHNAWSIELPGFGFIGRLERIIDDALDLGVERFFVTGGEPLAREDIFELIDRMTARASLALITNGTLIKGERLERLAISLDPDWGEEGAR